MTKSLTEQLNNGTLKDGLYYIKDNDNILIGLRYSLTMTRIIDDGCPSFEVLDHVPSYDEYKKLKEQLNDANEVIKKYSDGSIYLFPTWYNGSFEANKYLEKWGIK